MEGGIANPRDFSLTIGFRELEVTPFRGTKFLDIRAAAANAEEAAKIANAIVDACQKYHQAQAEKGGATSSIRVVTMATPPVRPFFPNRYLGGASLLLGGLLIVGWSFVGFAPRENGTRRLRIKGVDS